MSCVIDLALYGALVSFGTNWAALQPVPTTTTFLSLKSTLWSHRAEWKIGPLNVSYPGKSSGQPRGSTRPPTALITIFARTTSVAENTNDSPRSARTLWRSLDPRSPIPATRCLRVTSQTFSSSNHRHSSTSVLSWILSVIWYFSQTSCRYCTISDPGGKKVVHLGFGLKENE
jgi:hypothetical protein